MMHARQLSAAGALVRNLAADEYCDGEILHERIRGDALVTGMIKGWIANMARTSRGWAGPLVAKRSAAMLYFLARGWKTI
jgi:hypothetical protein